MYKRFIILTLLVTAITGLSSCSKKESPPPEPPKEQSSTMQDHPDHVDIQMPPAEHMKVIIPPDVKSKWKGVILTVTDKNDLGMKDYIVPISGSLIIPGSKIEVKAGDFLPDLKIDGNIYTTSSSDLLNPAIYIIVNEGGKEIFSGWLFQKFPNIHPFKHQRFGITLKEPVTSL